MSSVQQLWSHWHLQNPEKKKKRRKKSLCNVLSCIMQTQGSGMHRQTISRENSQDTVIHQWLSLSSVLPRAQQGPGSLLHWLPAPRSPCLFSPIGTITVLGETAASLAWVCTDAGVPSQGRTQGVAGMWGKQWGQWKSHSMAPALQAQPSPSQVLGDTKLSGSCKKEWFWHDVPAELPSLWLHQ